MVWSNYRTLLEYIIKIRNTSEISDHKMDFQTFKGIQHTSKKRVLATTKASSSPFSEVNAICKENCGYTLQSHDCSPKMWRKYAVQRKIFALATIYIHGGMETLDPEKCNLIPICKLDIAASGCCSGLKMLQVADCGPFVVNSLFCVAILALDSLKKKLGQRLGYSNEFVEWPGSLKSKKW